VGKAQYALGSSQQQRCDATPPSSVSDTATAEPYRMPYGKHSGMTLAEIPESYIWWLIKTPSSSRPIELTEALEAWKEEKKKQPKVSSQWVSMPSQTQTTPSKMPVSRETYTPPSSQVCQAPPSSSQVAMMSVHLSKYIYSPSSSQPSVSPTPSIPYPRPSQPTNTQHSLNAPLYVLPFGDFKGKTLHEVPEDYLLYLGASEDKLASLPGLADALRSMKQGLPPVAVKPTVQNLPSSQALSPQIRASSQVPMASQSQQAPPPFSSAPTHYTQSKDGIPSSSQSPSSQPPPRKEPYRLDFGKHEGKTIAEVPPDYIAFLKNKGTIETNKTLAAGLAEYEQNNPPITTSRKGKNGKPLQYRFSFGIHEGKTVAQVPPGYILFLKNKTTILKDKPEVGAAIRLYEQSRSRRSRRR
jgi:uncharacterized protein (DUF3820 family)